MTDMSDAPTPELPAGARFDPVSGALLGADAGGGGERKQSFALQPGEPVASFNVVSALMPLASGSAPQTYRWALGLGILIPVVAGALGFLAFAFVAAALVVPAVYVVYMYDVNQWEDQPVGVVLGAIGAAAALGVGFTFLWHAGILGDDLAPVDVDGTDSGIRWTSFLVLVLLVPIVERGAQGGRPDPAGPPAGVRRHDRRPDLRCGRGCRVRRRGDHRGQPRPVLDVRPRRLPERRLLGVADHVRRGGQADRVRRRDRHRGRQLLRSRCGLRRLQARPTSAAWPRPWPPTSSSRAACSSRRGTRGPRVPSWAWSGAR